MVTRSRGPEMSLGRTTTWIVISVTPNSLILLQVRVEFLDSGGFVPTVPNSLLCWNREVVDLKAWELCLGLWDTCQDAPSQSNDTL